MKMDMGSPKTLKSVTLYLHVDLNLISGSFALPEDMSEFARGYDYYVVLRTSDAVDYRDTWRVFVDDQDVHFRSGRSTMNTGVGTDSIAANLPVILSAMSEYVSHMPER